MSKIPNIAKMKSTDDVVDALTNLNKVTKYNMYYNKEKYKIHNEGDVWEEKGITWTIKNGIKYNIPKIDKKDLGVMPLFCPKCNKMMKKRDTPYWNQFNCCLDCGAEIITRMKIRGEWEGYIKDKEKNNFKSMLKYKKDELLDYKKNINYSTAMNSQGEIENWVSTNKFGLLEDVNKQIQEIDIILENIDKYEDLDQAMKNIYNDYFNKNDTQQGG